jgi:Flp pilus assembly pilin Flp
MAIVRYGSHYCSLLKTGPFAVWFTRPPRPLLPPPTNPMTLLGRRSYHPGMKQVALNLVFDETGQDLVEYTLLLAFVAFTSAGLIWGMGGNIAGITSTTNSQLTAANISAS